MTDKNANIVLQMIDALSQSSLAEELKIYAPIVQEDMKFSDEEMKNFDFNVFFRVLKEALSAPRMPPRFYKGRQIDAQTGPRVVYEVVTMPSAEAAVIPTVVTVPTVPTVVATVVPEVKTEIIDLAKLGEVKEVQSMVKPVSKPIDEISNIDESVHVEKPATDRRASNGGDRYSNALTFLCKRAGISLENFVVDTTKYEKSIVVRPPEDGPINKQYFATLEGRWHQNTKVWSFLKTKVLDQAKTAQDADEQQVLDKIKKLEEEN